MFIPSLHFLVAFREDKERRLNLLLCSGRKLCDIRTPRV